MPEWGNLPTRVRSDHLRRTLRRRLPQSLAHINEPAIDLVLWRRSLPAELRG